MSESFNSLSSNLQEDLINVQINNSDYYSESPTILDTKTSKSLPGLPFIQVPIIRIYGSLPTGHKVLVHFHGVFPYIYIRYDGEVSDSAAVIRSNCSKLHKLLEITMIEYFSKEKYSGKLKSLKHIANVSVVKGIPFYGYHVGYTTFYKISLLNSSYASKLCEFLRDGKVFASKTDVYEAHIPYLLQMMADFNLFGCGWLQLSRCYFRQPVLLPDLDMDELLNTPSLKKFLSQHLSEIENVLGKDPFHRIGNSLLEIDVLPQFIMNRYEIEFRNLHHDFIEINEDFESSTNSYVKSTRDIWKSIGNIRNSKGLPKYSIKNSQSRDLNLEYKWRQNENFLKYFEAAKTKTSTNAQYGVTFDNFISTAKNLSLFEHPKDALSELWPKTPRNVTSVTKNWYEKNLNSEINITVLERKILKSDHNTTTDDTSTSNSSMPVSNRKLSYDVMHSTPYESRDKLLKKEPSTLDCKISPYKKPSITFQNIKQNLKIHGLPEVQYSDPFYSNPLDCVKSRSEFAGTVYKLSSDHLSYRNGLAYRNQVPKLSLTDSVYQRCRWKYIRPKPTFEKVKAFEPSLKRRFSSVSGKTPESEFGYKFKSNKMENKSNNKTNRMTHLSMELHVNTRGDKFPDPNHDPVSMIFWKIQDGTFPFELNIIREGVLLLLSDKSQQNLWKSSSELYHMTFYEEELDMIYALEDLVKFFDPDILSGYEIHSSSWGYLIERCSKSLQHDLEEELSRVEYKNANKGKDKWGYTHATEFSITGRHMLNIWRPLKSSLNLLDYTLENIAFHVLHERMPYFSYKTRTELFHNKKVSSLRCLISYWMNRLKVNFELLETQNIISQTIEQARLIGIDFYSVFYRGSQYKVESFLIRLCKSEHFILFSPSKRQVRDQKSLECIPLVMEPSSGFYKSPLLVLDFQSLYPSIVMAYNYCYSTMLGRLESMDTKSNEIGTTTLDIPNDLLSLISDYITVSPNGIVFVKKELRQSTLAKMLKDILDTRFLIKETMKELSEEEDLLNMLDNNQAALKLLANVTYGYTSASYSGRMPCSDVADSIVQTGRETLERAIKTIESNSKWGAKVVYGDTDSLFVYLPGKSRAEAFKIGNAITSEITSGNPDPIRLKFEKVYHPSFLVTKKRYVGYSYENETQAEPMFDAKGIETVRRDGTPAQQKIVEKALRIMFETSDVSKVKSFVLQEFDKIISGKVNVQDFCFARSVKLGHYKNDKTAPPGAQIAMKMIEEDARAEPQYKQRVPYVVKMAKAGEPLNGRCISPEAFLRSKTARLDSQYYIVKNIIPPLQRFFQLIGVDIFEWYRSMPRTINAMRSLDQNDPRSLASIVHARSCLRCGSDTHPSHKSRVCGKCRSKRGTTIIALQEMARSKQSQMSAVLKVCQTCCYSLHRDSMAPMDQIALKCQSKDCPVYFSRVKYINGLKDTEMRDVLLGLIDLDY